MTKGELRWVMAEAVKVAEGPPDHLFLGATLGWVGVHTA